MQEEAGARRQVPPGVVRASMRVVGPARVLAALSGVLMRVAATSGASLAVAVVATAWGEGPALGAALVGALLLLVPAWWLRHARSTFRDVVALPARLQALDDGTDPFTVTKHDLTPAALRAGGIRAGVRTVRTTISEISDFLSPASTVLEVVAPPFWFWTAIAAGAALVLLVVAPLVLLVLAIA